MNSQHSYNYDPDYVNEMREEAKRLMELFHRQLNGGGNQLQGLSIMMLFNMLRSSSKSTNNFIKSS